jgi:crossover junction endodeoxyribonuclease RuvC
MRFVGIDPSTKTGFVAVDTYGTVLKAKELTGAGSEDPYRMITLIDEVMSFIQRGDTICIEGFGFASQQAIQLGGIGWGLRMALTRRGFKYIEASPSQLKKYASGKGNTPKNQLAVHVYKSFGFEHRSDNVIDAYVLAEIARCFSVGPERITKLKYQHEVIDAIKNPKPKNKKKTKA